DIQASIGLVQLRRLDELLRIRRAKAERYDQELAEIRGVEVPYVPPYAEHTYQSYCLRLTKAASVDRDDLMTRLLRRGIATRRGAGTAPLGGGARARSRRGTRRRVGRDEHPHPHEESDRGGRAVERSSGGAGPGAEAQGRLSKDGRRGRRDPRLGGPAPGPDRL